MRNRAVRRWIRISFFLCLSPLFVATLFPAEMQLGRETLDVEIANSPAERAKGLMGRKSLPEGSGMLFVFSKPQRLSFWMKNTLIPLSIGFFDEEKRLFQVIDMATPENGKLALYVSKAPAMYALEVPQGWFDRHGIGLGTKFVLAP